MTLYNSAATLSIALQFIVAGILLVAALAKFADRKRPKNRYKGLG